MPTPEETRIEEQIVAEKGDKFPRLTLAAIDAVIVTKTFHMTPSGTAMICELTLVNGFTVRGESAMGDTRNFVQSVGEEISERRARDKIWLVEGYLLQHLKHQERLRDEDHHERVFYDKQGTNNG